MRFIEPDRTIATTHYDLSPSRLFQGLRCGVLSAWGCLMAVDEEKVDDMVLALLYLTTFEASRG